MIIQVSIDSYIILNLVCIVNSDIWTSIKLMTNHVAMICFITPMGGNPPFLSFPTCWLKSRNYSVGQIKTNGNTNLCRLNSYLSNQVSFNFWASLAIFLASFESPKWHTKEIKIFQIAVRGCHGFLGAMTICHKWASKLTFFLALNSLYKLHTCSALFDPWTAWSANNWSNSIMVLLKLHV